LGQVHDAIFGQYETGDRDAAHIAIMEAMIIPLTINGRTMTITTEMATGSNWGKRSEKNPKGMA